MHSSRLIVGVAGISGSGKSTVCAGLARRLGPERVLVIPMDAYYRDLSRMTPAARARVNFDSPAALDLDQLVRDLATLRSGLSVAVPRYDFATHTRAVAGEVVRPAPVILVEGLFCLAHAPLAEALDLKVFVDAPEQVCLKRRMDRDVNQRGRRAGDVLEQYFASVLPAARAVVHPSRDAADVCVPGTRDRDAVVDQLIWWVEGLLEAGRLDARLGAAA